MGKKTTAGGATALFHNCQLQAQHAFWHKRGLIGADFRSKHMLLVLHVWMVHKRLMFEGKSGQSLQEALFDELWEDTSNRIRGQGVAEISVNKYLKEVQSYSFRCCVELDRALDQYMQGKEEPGSAAEAVEAEVGSAEEKLEDDIGGVLWRLLYLRREEIDVDHVLELAKYVVREQVSLSDVSKDAVFEGRIQWGALPSWRRLRNSPSTANTSTAATSSDEVSTPSTAKKPSGAGEWKEATAADGRSYFWNTVTRESRWDKPKDL